MEHRNFVLHFFALFIRLTSYPEEYFDRAQSILVFYYAQRSGFQTTDTSLFSS